MVYTAGSLGFIEILIIVGCILWIMNMFRKSSVLRKMDQQLDQMQQQQSNHVNKSKKRVSDHTDKGEYVDYEEVE